VIATGAGAASRRSLGTAVFGGMLIATVGGIVMISAPYSVVQTATERLGGRQAAAPADQVTADSR
jgi:HAE1 family hydrophobic/amphiphilic exporter-1